MEAIVRNMAENDKTALVRLGFQSALLIKNLLIADAIQAVKDLEVGKLTPPLPASPMRSLLWQAKLVVLQSNLAARLVRMRCMTACLI